MSDPFAPEGVVFTPVSRELIKVRSIALLITYMILLSGSVATGFLFSYWIFIATGIFFFLATWQIWLVRRQVRALGWAEGKEEFMIRKGIMFRSLTLVPYGRIQYVDVKEGPIARHYGITTITLHTASPETSATLDGVPAKEASRLRDLLAERGSAELAGL
ncbi:PH domain-containing protein [Schaalia sp. lx-260]|uniref:PH domain-containing protein n=1 Tax=Schaalia sp. lx-260 TaxID=2899082 RepID=UPI001E42D6E3|nr:PH domain-containing protein [Schaalia sp. lx-260]MCD4549913.1 PH domain-containing protein [Schaalia sp. lx-260]